MAAGKGEGEEEDACEEVFLAGAKPAKALDINAVGAEESFLLVAATLLVAGCAALPPPTAEPSDV